MPLLVTERLVEIIARQTVDQKFAAALVVNAASLADIRRDCRERTTTRGRTSGPIDQPEMARLRAMRIVSATAKYAIAARTRQISCEEWQFWQIRKRLDIDPRDRC